VRALLTLSGILAPTAGSASGGFSRHIPPLPVTPAVSALGHKVKVFMMENDSISSVFRELTSSPTFDEFNAFDGNQILEAKRVILAEPSNLSILNFSQF